MEIVKMRISLVKRRFVGLAILLCTASMSCKEESRPNIITSDELVELDTAGLSMSSAVDRHLLVVMTNASALNARLFSMLFKAQTGEGRGEALGNSYAERKLSETIQMKGDTSLLLLMSSCMNDIDICAVLDALFGGHAWDWRTTRQYLTQQGHAIEPTLEEAIRGVEDACTAGAASRSRHSTVQQETCRLCGALGSTTPCDGNSLRPYPVPHFEERLAISTSLVKRWFALMAAAEMRLGTPMASADQLRPHELEGLQRIAAEALATTARGTITVTACAYFELYTGSWPDSLRHMPPDSSSPEISNISMLMKELDEKCKDELNRRVSADPAAGVP